MHDILIVGGKITLRMRTYALLQEVNFINELSSTSSWICNLRARSVAKIPTAASMYRCYQLATASSLFAVDIVVCPICLPRSTTS